MSLEEWPLLDCFDESPNADYDRQDQVEGKVGKQQRSFNMFKLQRGEQFVHLLMFLLF